MSTLLATTAIPSATVAALGRLHSNNRSSSGSSGSSTSNKISGRQRSSSLTIRTATIITPTDPASSATPSPILTSRRLPSITSQGEGSTETRGPSWALPSMRKSSSSRNNPVESAAIATPQRDRAHQQQGQNHQGTDGLGRINLVPLSGTNLGNSTNDHKPSKVYSGRSRSNTLTGLGSSVNGFELASAPRRSSITGKPPVPIVTLSQSPCAPANSHNSHLRYPPPSTLPQYQAVAIADGDDDDDAATIGNSLSTDEKPKPYSSSMLSSWGPSWVSQIQLGFLPRIIILISLFGLSLGGLYLLAQVLPPLSLPKSIDDVKVDAAILQDFATATYEGWIRTFWVFCVVYIWKQCFGIPGSAFLNILAGALYGPWFGTLLTSALTTLGSVLAYFMSYFLMEPILSRYASTRLDQMRLQIQKAARSSSKPSLSSSSSTSTASTTTTAATSTAVQTLHATPSIPLSGTTFSTTTNHFSSPSTRGMLRTRSSSFTGRRPDCDGATTQQPPQFNRLLNVTSVDEIEILENDRLLNETNSSKTKPNVNYADSASQQGPDTNSDSDTVVEEADHENKDEDEDEDEEEQGPSLFMQLLLIRLFPLTPYWFINLASPLVGVPVMPFVTSMFLGCMPYNYICAQAGAILGEIHQMSDIYQQPWILFQIIFVLVLSAGATWASKRWTRRQQQKDDQKQQNGGSNGRSHKSRDSDEEDGDEEESTRGLLQHRQDQEEGSYRLSTDSISIPMGILGHDQYSDTGRNTQRHDSAIVDMNFYRH